MSDSAENLVHAAERLREAGARLRERPPRETLAALCRVLDAWSGPESTHQRRLEADLEDSSGFSKPVIRAGLARGLADWNGNALRAVVERELGTIDRLDATGASPIAGFELTATILAGAIPMPTLLAILLPLVLQSPVLVKTSQRDRKTAHHVTASIAEVDTALARCVEVVDFPRDDIHATEALLAAPCIVAMGSDPTLEELARHVHPWQRWVAYGQRLSLAVLGPHISNTPGLLPTTEKLAQDVALWDQSGCLSAAAIFVVGTAKTAAEVADCLADALRDLVQRWPRGPIGTPEAAAIHREREESRLRAAAGQQVRVHASDDTGWTVIAEADADWRPTPLHRFVRVYPVADIPSLSAALAPLSPYLSSVALEGFGSERAGLAGELIRLGASRLCAPGDLQAPPLGWHHDGRPLLLPITRLSDDEQPNQRAETSRS
ncbi:MAG: acyl-CoA reductase [Myxococcota bacterium]